jgi:hypothetical protein
MFYVNGIPLEATEYWWRNKPLGKSSRRKRVMLNITY